MSDDIYKLLGMPTPAEVEAELTAAENSCRCGGSGVIVDEDGERPCLCSG
jgi:hypothetical protein